MVEIPHIDLSTYIIDKNTLGLVPAIMAKKYRLIPIFKIGNTLTIAMSDPTNVIAIDDVRNATGMDLDIVTSSPEDISIAISNNYGFAGTIGEIIKDVGKETITATDRDVPIVKLVDMIIMEAVVEKASDIHIEPEENNLRVRFRIDGILHRKLDLEMSMLSPIISRIKVVGGMDIAENRIPQDGRFEVSVDNRPVDIRVSTFPSVKGEKVVMRLLDKISMLVGLEEVGFSKEDLDKFKNIIKRPYGMILVTGPTGSGKTTTLYSALSSINSEEKNIITVEDPVEFEIAGINQCQVNTKAGLTFSNALRSILRQDPDIILVGEIRDLETARIAIQAALTGHLVFSTLHTNDACSTLARLIDMGIEPFLIATSVIDIIAQRLVRKLCNICYGKGCHACAGSGYKGRMGLFEQLIVDDKIVKLINERASSVEIQKAAIASGMKTIKEDGLIKVGKNLTSKEEIMRVTAFD